jgi:hypothetical protein
LLLYKTAAAAVCAGKKVFGGKITTKRGKREEKRIKKRNISKWRYTGGGGGALVWVLIWNSFIVIPKPPALSVLKRLQEPFKIYYHAFGGLSIAFGHHFWAEFEKKTPEALLLLFSPSSLSFLLPSLTA